ncbi:palmitoyltransferase Erf2 [Schizosaccharomyces osmophilus]|uniref:Palmitoyltransferase n=1 Tax=Schizosaccharomyces osmophilus TaxID=2545709 RepID=A0AAF0AXP6_9SCHI|nr:palmitoyltransferase Erf2 [Schizosaccharomyces osmophilus]WBW74285.1 palmitoyltransferase Erf2 [Schizosaccharomyces osmophilus]
MSPRHLSKETALRYPWKQPWNPNFSALSDPTNPINPNEKTDNQQNITEQTLHGSEVQQIERRYKHFPGNNVFFLGGRFQMSTQFKAFAITLFALLLPGVLFFIFSAFWLWHQVSPAIPITFSYIYALVMISMLKCSTSDPGILPRNSNILIYDPTHPWSVIPEDKRLLIGSTRSDSAFLITTVYCHTCRLYRPPRASHCHLCDNCVEYLDHHCTWLNNCIGRRNYRYFFIFLLSLFFEALYLTVLGFYIAFASFRYGSDTNFARHLQRPWAGVSFFLGIYAALGSIFPGILLGYQCYLIGCGQNVHEFLRSKNTETEDVRPYHNSVWINFLTVLCRPKNVSYVRPRRKEMV